MLVQQILNQKAGVAVVTILPSASVADAAQLLSERRIGAVVVSPDGKAVDGILSERDIVRNIGTSGPGCLDQSVTQMMTKKIVTASAKEQIDSVLSKMTSGRFRHIPVMEGEEMIGLISIGDVVKAQLSSLSMEKEALEGMIKGF